MVGVAVMGMLVHITGLRGFHMGDAAHDRIKSRFRLQLAVDKDVADARRGVRMVLDFRRWPDLGRKNITRIFPKIALAFHQIGLAILLRVAATAEQYCNGSGAASNLIFMPRAGGNID